jgi:hypothetical protein
VAGERNKQDKPADAEPTTTAADKPAAVMDPNEPDASAQRIKRQGDGEHGPGDGPVGGYTEPRPPQKSGDAPDLGQLQTETINEAAENNPDAEDSDAEDK